MTSYLAENHLCLIKDNEKRAFDEIHYYVDEQRLNSPSMPAMKSATVPTEV